MWSWLQVVVTKPTPQTTSVQYSFHFVQFGTHLTVSCSYFCVDSKFIYPNVCHRLIHLVSSFLVGGFFIIVQCIVVLVSVVSFLCILVSFQCPTLTSTDTSFTCHVAGLWQRKLSFFLEQVSWSILCTAKSFDFSVNFPWRSECPDVCPFRSVFPNHVYLFAVLRSLPTWICLSEPKFIHVQ